MMYFRWLSQLTAWLTFTALAPVGYFLARYANTGVSIWGNSADGFCGDQPYKDKEAKAWFRKLWPCFWWSVVRNPANNYARNVAYGTVIRMQRSKHLTIATLGHKEQRRSVWFFYTPDWPVTIKLGYKIWPQYRTGDTIRPKLAFSIQRSK